MIKAFAPAGIPRLEEVDPQRAGRARSPRLSWSWSPLIVGLAPASVAAAHRGDRRRCSDRPRVGRPRDDPAARRAHGHGDRARRLARRLRGIDAAQPASVLTESTWASRPTHASVSRRISRRRAYPDAARVDVSTTQLDEQLAGAAGHASHRRRVVSAAQRRRAVGRRPRRRGARRTSEPTSVGWDIVRGRYFETMGIALLPGDLFDAAIGAASARGRDRRRRAGATALVRRARRRRSVSACGSVGTGRRRDRARSSAWCDHVSHAGPARTSLPMAYAPQTQVYQRGMYTGDPTTRTAPRGADAAARAALASVDPIGADVLRRDGGHALRRRAGVAAVHGRSGERVFDAGAGARRRRHLRRDAYAVTSADARVRNPSRARRAAYARRAARARGVSALLPCSGSRSGRRSASASAG